MLGTALLGMKDAKATVAVKDLQVAEKFYGGVLGLNLVDHNSEVLVYTSGSTTILVYKSQYAGTNHATSVTWTVGEDVESIAETLKGKGVNFERYDLPGMKREGDVHVAGNMRAAWFKDPDGNILSIVSG